MKQHAAALIVTAATAGMLILGCTAVGNTPHPETGIGEPDYHEPTTTRIEEDDPRWDCRTMGNLTCGVTIHGTAYVVTFTPDGAPATVTEYGK